MFGELGLLRSKETPSHIYAVTLTSFLYHYNEGLRRTQHFRSQRRTTEQTRWCYCEATIRENEAQSSAAVVTKMQIHKLWQYFFFHKTNNGLTVEKFSSREGHVHNYSGGRDGNSDAARVAVHYSYPSLYLGSFAQFQEKANNHISLQTGL